MVAFKPMGLGRIRRACEGAVPGHPALHYSIRHHVITNGYEVRVSVDLHSSSVITDFQILQCANSDALEALVLAAIRAATRSVIDYAHEALTERDE